jgi:PadR family transcriptional regulator AphA
VIGIPTVSAEVIVIRENKTKYALLGVLSMGPMSADDIKEVLVEQIRYVWKDSHGLGSIYPMLNRMLFGGLVEKTIEKRDGRRNRKVYHLTEKGLEVFRQWHTRPIDYQIVHKELLLKLIFGSKVEPNGNIKQVTSFQKMHKELLKVYEAKEQEFANRRDDPDARFKIFAARYCMNESRALLAWCDETLEMLHNMERPRS